MVLGEVVGQWHLHWQTQRHLELVAGSTAAPGQLYQHRLSIGKYIHTLVST